VTNTVAITTVDLARIQFATTSIYHFFFVPLTLGLGPIVAVMQTKWHRTQDERWLRLTHFFGALFLINFAIGVATGLVQEFQFGMNWSVYSKFVGNIFGAPLAIEGLAAFMLEATFLGLWIFGWNRLSPRVHLATLWIAVAGSWMSGFFILVANSWMQHPVGYKIVDGEAHLTSVWALLSNGFALRAYVHTILAGLIFGSTIVLGICCWHFLRGRNVDLFRKALRRSRDERAEHEDRRLRGTVEHLPAMRFLAHPVRRVHRAGSNPQLLDHDPATPLLHGHGLVQR
jgi:cytochrome d ubiquinol oxidase subunit I